MRVLAIIMLVITLLAGAFLGYCTWGAQMQIQGVSVTMTPATDALGTYNDIVHQLENGSFYGTKYREVEYVMPDSFAFLTLTVRMQNRGLLPMEWIRIEVAPDAADAVQLPESRTPTLAGSTRSDFSATVLTRTGASEARALTITYYVLGQKFTVSYQMAE